MSIFKPSETILFRRSLLEWYGRHRRDLPWRRLNDPYAIWVSEIMLQQTRVAAVIPFYERFLRRFPTFHELAAADESVLLTHWAGLGYYYRARNMQKAAQMMVASGRFPEKYENILALPGIGEYTAAAVGSISFGLPYPVVDGNVYRVLSRVAADPVNIASSKARSHFTRLAAELLDPADPGGFNQAVMELGATVCLPKRPMCLVCPVAGLCKARQAGTEDQFPVKSKPQKSVDETRVLYWVERDGCLLLWQRPDSSKLMPGFWELPEAAQLPFAKQSPPSARFRHGITFHNYEFLVSRTKADDIGGCQFVELSRLDEMPLSTIVRKARKSMNKAGTSLAAASSRV